MQYYANFSTSWICNITVGDYGGTQKKDSGLLLNLTDTEVSSAVTLNKLLAINTSTLLDYGNLSVTQVSDSVQHNVTNVGNIDLNLSLRGFGGDVIDGPGMNVTMMCDLGNISIGNQRYSIGLNESSFANMRNLTNQTAISNFTLPARSLDSDFGSDRNATFFRL